MKDKEDQTNQISEGQSSQQQKDKVKEDQTNQTPEGQSSQPQKDKVKEKLLEMKSKYGEMIRLRKENLDSFKKIDMSKKIIVYNYNNII